MTKSSRRGDAGTLGLGWPGRVATALMAAALFVLLLVFGALAIAVAMASAVVMQAKLWWLSRRRLAGRASGRGGETTLDVEYEVLSSHNDGGDPVETGTPGNDRNEARRSGS